MLVSCVVRWWLALTVAFSAVTALAEPNELYDPPALFLTWKRDPARTMIIHWQTVGEARAEAYYRASGAGDWTKAQGESHPFPKSKRTIHTVELTGLAPRSDYEFCFLPGEKTFRFRTLPATLVSPVRFVNGGDAYHERNWMDTMNRLAGKFDPAFVVIGGDLAYSCGGKSPERMERWDDYFDSWKTNARASDGRLVPLLVTIGNHEVVGSWDQSPTNAQGFYALFPLPGERGYACLDFGNYLSLFLLDSSITHPIEGAQTDWLRHELAKRRTMPHIIPVYHIPAYPSIRSDATGQSSEHTQMIRRSWCPLFEEAGVAVAFEHHDHSNKRTHPIRKGKIDPTGIVYLGDGAWGVRLRQPDRAKPRWYIARSDGIRHLYVVTLYPESCHVLAVNDHGEVFDEVYRRLPVSAAAN